MTAEDIFKSGFVKAFIRAYFEEQIHVYYPDKDRLLYLLCGNEEEKVIVTKEQISKIKSNVSDIGFEELSSGYLLSCRPESGHNYIEPSQRFEFWLNRFAEHFEDWISSFDEVTKAFLDYKNLTELSVEAIKDEGDFWETYPTSQKPIFEELVVNIFEETELLSTIDYSIAEFKENGYWEIDFEDYQKFIEVSKPIELLFNLSELLVQLSRLEMFKNFLDLEVGPTHQTASKTQKYKAKHFVLAYLIECNAKGKNIPTGMKKKLEQIGSDLMGAGRGNTFYKNFNDIINKDLNSKNTLIEIGGENWRKIVKDLSSEPETIEQYLQSKQL